MERPRVPFYLTALFTVAAVVVALLLAPARIVSVIRGRTERLISNFPPPRNVTSLKNMSTTTSRTPVYFLSHGGVSSGCTIRKTNINYN